MAWVGCPIPPRARSELETAQLPNLDALAKGGTCGLISPLGAGFTPGSGPAHLALFGYDPWRNQIGRGALSALGLGLDFARGDVAARLNFCTVDAAGRVSDRRAGRIPTEKGRQLCEVLRAITVSGVEVQVAAEMEYRAGVVFRGAGLGDQVSDSDPQVTGVPPKPLSALTPDAERTVEVANAFLAQAAALLADEHPANMVLLRGIWSLSRVGVDGRGVWAESARHCRISHVPRGGRGRGHGCRSGRLGTSESEFALLESRYADYDFFYVHVKKTDSAGEDGDFDLKVRLLEELDAYMPRLLALQPEVLIVTGDHSTPSIYVQPQLASSAHSYSQPVGVGRRRG